MSEEYEVKFLDIDPEKMEKKILALGGKKIFDRVYRVKVFDYPDLRLHEEGAWVRVRDEGDKVTMSFKKRLGIKGHGGQTNDDGMEEYEIVVSDFDTAVIIMLKMGMYQKFYEEKRRVRYILDGIEVDIDFCPAIKPYLEIEGRSWGEVESTIKKLDLNPEDKKIFSTTQIYKLNGIRQLDYEELTFKELKKREKC